MTALLALMQPPPDVTERMPYTCHLRPGSLEWDRAWYALAANEINAKDADCADPETGERWQYLGTVEDPTGGSRHEFHHRHHPRTGQCETLAILPFRRPSTDPDSYRSATP